MSEEFKVEIVNPEQSFLLKEDVTEVVVPAYEGEMGILKDHISIISFLKPGMIKIFSKSGEENYYVEDGIVEFKNNNLSVLTSSIFNLKDADKNKGHKVMKFNVLQASVRAYQRNLNTHSSYEEFRKERAKLRDKKMPLDSLLLSEFLDQYAQTGNQYVEVLQKIIKQNNLKDFDDAKLLPSSIKLESLI